MVSARRVIPIVAQGTQRSPRQRWRALTQASFFLLFVLAPVFDLLRLDLTLGHFVILGHNYTLGLGPFQAGQMSTTEAAFRVVLRVFAPLVILGGGLLYVAWRWGRLYCGWLCPHFSVVETINGLMRRATGRNSLWDRTRLPNARPDGSRESRHAAWWPVTSAAIVGFAFTWAVVLLTYLLPPERVYSHLIAGELARSELIFIAAATIVFTIEFTLARHLFCRYACAVGMFQSLAWMGNPRAMVIGFDRSRAAECARCFADTGPGYAACEGVCPMRLKPRNIKRLMFACTQCGQCADACATVQRGAAREPLLAWIGGEAAKQNEAGFAAPRVARRC